MSSPHYTLRRFDTSSFPVPLLLGNSFFHDFFAEWVFELSGEGGEED